MCLFLTCSLSGAVGAVVSTTEAAVADLTTGEEEVVVALAALATWAIAEGTVEGVEVAGAVVAAAWAVVTWAVVVVARGAATTGTEATTAVVASAESRSSHRDRAVEGDIKPFRHVLYC